jgi:hypothetical protein
VLTDVTWRWTQGWRGIDIDEGAYGVDFVPTEGPGKYKINVRRGGKHIPNSPFIVDLGDAKKLPSTKLPFTARRKDGSPINNATRTPHAHHHHHCVCTREG